MLLKEQGFSGATAPERSHPPELNLGILIAYGPCVRDIWSATMEYRTLSEVAESAWVSSAAGISPRARRRERLERLAALLDAHQGPIRLLARIEYLSAEQRARLRADPSPLTIAFNDPVFRAEGLKSDRLGDAMDFFVLNEGQAHHLVCDCHYPVSVTAAMIAGRVRAVARRPSWADRWAKFHAAVVRHASAVKSAIA